MILPISYSLFESLLSMDNLETYFYFAINRRKNTQDNIHTHTPLVPIVYSLALYYNELNFTRANRTPYGAYTV